MSADINFGLENQRQRNAYEADNITDLNNPHLKCSRHKHRLYVKKKNCMYVCVFFSIMHRYTLICEHYCVITLLVDTSMLSYQRRFG